MLFTRSSFENYVTPWVSYLDWQARLVILVKIVVHIVTWSSEPPKRWEISNSTLMPFLAVRGRSGIKHNSGLRYMMIHVSLISHIAYHRSLILLEFPLEGRTRSLIWHVGVYSRRIAKRLIFLQCYQFTTMSIWTPSTALQRFSIIHHDNHGLGDRE